MSKLKNFWRGMTEGVNKGFVVGSLLGIPAAFFSPETIRKHAVLDATLHSRYSKGFKHGVNVWSHVAAIGTIVGTLIGGIQGLRRASQSHQNQPEQGFQPEIHPEMHNFPAPQAFVSPTDPRSYAAKIEAQRLAPQERQL